MKPDNSPRDPAKKYWWLVLIVVPIVVALISRQSGGEGGVKPQPVPTLDDLDGSVWTGTTTYLAPPGDANRVTLRITKKAEGKYYVDRDNVSPRGEKDSDRQEGVLDNKLFVITTRAGNITTELLMGNGHTMSGEVFEITPDGKKPIAKAVFSRE